MYYQLTMQFGTDEIEDAKKVLELAKELDLKHAGSEKKLPEPETFPREEEVPTKETPTHKEKESETKIPMAKDWTTQDEPVSETAKEITLEELQKAGVDFAKEKGVAVLKVLLTQMGASKICEIPKEKYQEAWEALHA